MKTEEIVDNIRVLIGKLHPQEDLDARDRAQLFIIMDLLGNLSPIRAIRDEALKGLIEASAALDEMEFEFKEEEGQPDDARNDG